MRQSFKFALITVLLTAPVLMANYPDAPGEKIGLYGGTGRYQTGGCNSELRGFNEISGSYRHTFEDGKKAVGMGAGFVETRHREWVDPPPGEMEHKPYERAYLLNPYFSWNPWRYFGFDAGVLTVFSPDNDKAIFNDLPSIKNRVYPSAGVRAGLLDKAYLNLRLYHADNIMVANYFWAADVVMLNTPSHIDISLGVSGMPDMPFVPQASLRIKVSELVTIPPMAKLQMDSDYRGAAGYGAATGVEFTF